MARPHSAPELIRALIALSAVGLCACQRAPIGPTPTQPPQSFTGRIVLSGQSNAVNVAPFLSVYGIVDTVAQKSLSIDYWSATNPDVTMWRDLEPHLHGDLRAFLWWQGESDSTNPQYETALVELLTRIRAITPAPFVLVQVLPKYPTVRIAQQHAAARVGAALVSIDPCEREGDSDHLTAAGYQCATAQILAVLTR